MYKRRHKIESTIFHELLQKLFFLFYVKFLIYFDTKQSPKGVFSPFFYRDMLHKTEKRIVLILNYDHITYRYIFPSHYNFENWLLTCFPLKAAWAQAALRGKTWRETIFKILAGTINVSIYNVAMTYDTPALCNICMYM